MESALDHAPCGYLCFDDEARVTLINQTLAQWLGTSIEAVVGQSLSKILAPGGAIFHQTHFFPLLKLHGEVGEIYLSLLTTNGEKLPVMVNAVRRENGGAPLNECVLLPMHQRHHFEEELIQARQVAERARDAKARFLSMLAHEVRSPLSSITGLAEVLRRKLHGPLEPEQVTDVNMILQAGKDIDRLIDNVLRYARAEAGTEPSNHEPVDLAGVLTRVETLMRARWDEVGLEYRRQGTLAGCFVMADAMQLQQILLNLLSNAAKFTPSGGTVTLHCASADDPGLFRIEVRDSGRGIPSSQLEEIFQPFVQVGSHAESQRGVGLGLAICRQFVNGMGGTLHAESELGVGSTFVLSLPGSKPPEAQG
ncbi:MAG: ATP-binding protein [Thermomonas sp.]